MKRLAVLIFFLLCGTAQAQCQTISVINHANVHKRALALVELASSIQAEEVSTAWGTPCVQFGPGGWVITLTVERQVLADGETAYRLDGHHYYSSQPYAVVSTGALTYKLWARAFTHELIEMLHNPDLSLSGQPFGEIADPYENWTYDILGVPVSDWELPSGADYAGL